MKGTEKKSILLYILQILEDFSDKNHTLTQKQIAEKLGNKGYYKINVKTVANNLLCLKDFGYNIHGIGEYCEGKPMERGKIWLEKGISDERLSWLIDSVKYNVFVDNKTKKELINNIISLGSKTFKESHKAATIVDGGKIFEVEGQSIFEQLRVINEACSGNNKYQIKFKYGKMAVTGSKVFYQEEKIVTVSPYWVVVQRGNTYLIGYNHNENKIWHFRVDKMKDVEMTSDYAKHKNDTELKGIDVGDYVLEHPLMFSGDLVTVELKIKKDFIGAIYETFGANFSMQEDDADTLKISRLLCGDLDMFYWAIQFGDIVEVIKPIKLRDKIREQIEGMSFKYKSTDGDGYSEAIRTAERNGTLDLRGIDLTNKTEHQKLKNVKRLYLSNNKIDNIDFVKNMPNLTEIRLEYNNVTDITPLRQLKHLYSVHLINVPIKSLDDLENLPIVALRVDLENADLNAIIKMKRLERLSISDKCSLNSTLNWGNLDKNAIRLDIFDRDVEKVSRNENYQGGINGQYPFNILKKCFGVDKEIVGELDEIAKDVSKMLDMLSPKEKQCAEYIFINMLSNETIREKMGLGDHEFFKLKESLNEKMYHPYFNGHLKKYVKEEDLSQNKKTTATERDDIIEKLRKRGFVVKKV